MNGARMSGDELVIEGKHITRDWTPIVVEGVERLRLVRCRVDGSIICDHRFAQITLEDCIITQG